LKSSGFIATLLIAAKLYIQTDCRGYGSTGNGDIAKGKGDGLGLAADGLSQEAARTTAPVFIVGWGFHGQNTEAPSWAMLPT
jgi:hypothetical protein